MPQKLQQFRCHKVVEAMKVEQIRWVEPMTLIGPGGLEVPVDRDYMAKHEPKVGGYYVRYENGYESWSPADAFEGGYTLVASEATPLSDLVETKYPVTEEVLRRFESAFVYHPPKGDQAARYQILRNWGKQVATRIVELTPPSREQSLALTKLEEVLFWANASIARGEK